MVVVGTESGFTSWHCPPHFPNMVMERIETEARRIWSLNPKSLANNPEFEAV